MAGPFDYFVLFAEMRTGSNFLETNLNAISGVACHGEAFNPHFIGYPNKDQILGVTLAMREADPGRLIAAIRDAPGDMGGFRFFHDHDARALNLVIDDPRCAKIVLTRNPLDSYISWKIAQATGQWKLTNVNRRKEAKAAFDAAEFAHHVEALQAFQVTLLNRLQVSGQAAFYVAYEDLQNLEVMNGLAKWLGIEGRLERLDQSLKRQNPSPMADKVANPEEMRSALVGMDQFNLTRTPNFEPRRGPAVPSYVAGSEVPLLYMPVRGGPEKEISDWLAALDGVNVDDLSTGMNQKQVRQWKRKHPGHRSFTVLRHPVARAHSVFCNRILNTGPGGFIQIRETLRRQFKLEIPDGESDATYTLSAHRRAFEAYLEFVRVSIAGQTAIRFDGAWGTQAGAVSAFGDFALPDFILREEELPRMLPLLAEFVGRKPVAGSGSVLSNCPFQLSDIYDEELEALVADVYQRDYMMFGFASWSADQAACTDCASVSSA